MPGMGIGNRDRAAAPGALDWFLGRSSALVNTVRDFAAMDTPSGDAEALAAFAGAYARGLTVAGLEPKCLEGPHGPQVFAERPAAGAVRPPIVLVGHADTVWPRGEAERRPPHIEGARLFGPGVYDMKAGL